MDPQQPRIEPDLTARPPARPEERVAAKAAPSPTKKMAKKRSSLFMRLIKLVLLLIALVILPVILLKWVPPPTTAFMLESPTKPVQYHWVPANRIADAARKAVIAAEDQKFRTHNGFDVEAMEKAYAHNKKSKRKRGASTISQQTAKNVFLWSGGGYFRKGVEAGITLLIENIWGKDRILEMYLNIAEFGPGIYGVEAASQAYFHKSAAQLTPNEAARLAAVLPSPRRWKVTAPGAYVQKRVSWIMGQMGYGHGPSEEPEPPSVGPESGGQLNDVDDAVIMDSAPMTPESSAPISAEPAPEAEPVPAAPAPEPETAPAPAPAPTP